MTLDISIQTVAAVPLAVVKSQTPMNAVPAAIRAGLDKVWPSLRGRGITGFGHNVIVYRGARREGDVTLLDMESGVQTPTLLDPDGEVVPSMSPAGRAVVAVHIGPYDRIRLTTDAAHAWMRERGLPVGGPSWEVYGDWEEDPAKLRTDLHFLIPEGVE